MFMCMIVNFHTAVDIFNRQLLVAEPRFTLQFGDVHLQDEYNDCGFFSIAYAVALCFAIHPGGIVFDQNKMR